VSPADLKRARRLCTLGGFSVSRRGIYQEPVPRAAVECFLDAFGLRSSMVPVPQLNEHAQQLYEDLRFLAEDGVTSIGMPIAEVYNTLLRQAKTQFPTDRVVNTLEPVDDTMHPRVLRALVGQLRLVLGNA